MSESSLPLGALKLQSLIGRGGVGEVWQAVDALGRLPVAVKVPPVAAGAATLSEACGVADAVGVGDSDSDAVEGVGVGVSDVSSVSVATTLLAALASVDV